MKFLIGYLILINLLSFFIMRKDKLAAIAHKQRIPENTLFLLAILGGSLGSIFAMIYYHHKSRKYKFLIGFPIIFVLHIYLLIKVLPSIG